MFKTNVGNIDSLARIAVGLVLIGLVFVGPKTAFGRAAARLLAAFGHTGTK